MQMNDDSLGWGRDTMRAPSHKQKIVASGSEIQISSDKFQRHDAERWNKISK